MKSNTIFYQFIENNIIYSFFLFDNHTVIMDTINASLIYYVAFQCTTLIKLLRKEKRKRKIRASEKKKEQRRRKEVVEEELIIKHDTNKEELKIIVIMKRTLKIM